MTLTSAQDTWRLLFPRPGGSTAKTMDSLGQGGTELPLTFGVVVHSQTNFRSSVAERHHGGRHVEGFLHLARGCSPCQAQVDDGQLPVFGHHHVGWLQILQGTSAPVDETVAEASLGAVEERQEVCKERQEVCKERQEVCKDRKCVKKDRKCV